LLTSKWAVDL